VSEPKRKLMVLVQVSGGHHDCEKLDIAEDEVTRARGTDEWERPSNDMLRVIALPEDDAAATKDLVMVGPLNEKDEPVIEAFPSKG
jgi:hypothetical protein